MAAGVGVAVPVGLVLFFFLPLPRSPSQVLEVFAMGAASPWLILLGPAILVAYHRGVCDERQRNNEER